MSSTESRRVELRPAQSRQKGKLEEERVPKKSWQDQVNNDLDERKK